MPKLTVIARLLLVLALLFSLAAAMAACGEEDGEEVTPLKIGQLNSFSGDLSDFGTAHRQAAQLAIDHVNQAGGVQGELVQLVARDTATNPVVGVDAAKALVNVDNAVAVVGALSSGVSIAVGAPLRRKALDRTTSGESSGPPRSSAPRPRPPACRQASRWSRWAPSDTRTWPSRTAARRSVPPSPRKRGSAAR